jgi:glycosyltransferase involved in cell wall biosynthesis
VKRLLVFAYYFPPMGGSGVQRVARIVRHLRAHGWQPVVATASPSRYLAWDDELLAQVERAGVQIVRTCSLDPLHLPAPSGRATHAPTASGEGWGASVLRALLVPDSKVGWVPFALRAALRLHRQHPFDAILSSGPPHSSHLAAALASRLTGVPLVLDYRDDWVDAPRQRYSSPLHRRLHAALERWAVGQTREVWSVSGQIAADIRARYPDAQVATLPHGFDADYYPPRRPARPPAPMRMLYAGQFYGAQQPDTFLRALAQVRSRADIISVFAGSLPPFAEQMIADLALRDRVERLGYLSAEEAAAQMRHADALWMTVGHQKRGAQIVTSKLSAYFGSGRPILGLVPPGAARDALQDYGASYIADPDDVEATAAHLISLYDAWKLDRLPTPDAAFVACYDGRAVAARAAARLDALARGARADRDRRPAERSGSG